MALLETFGCPTCTGSKNCQKKISSIKTLIYLCGTCGHKKTETGRLLGCAVDLCDKCGKLMNLVSKTEEKHGEE